MKNSAKMRILVFVIILACLTVASRFLPESSNFTMLFIMWMPGIAALLTSLVTWRSLKQVGWKPNWKWMGMGWLLPVFYGAIAFGIIWALGLGGIPKASFIENGKLTMGMTSNNEILIIIAAFFYITILNLLPNMLFALGEELGWRGFLVPELNKITSFWKTALFSGIIWFGWHLPAILSGNYGAEGTPLWFQVVCFTVLVLAGAVVLAFLRLRSGSIWPCVIFHAVHNGVIQHFFTNLTADTGKTEYFIGEFGIMVPLISLFFAAYFLWKYNKQESHDISAEILEVSN
ncbi:hypothetical protein C7S20_09135 [Christiangramia fulva]|uniref:CAAX prenyl protease 2/Lysostaphin resistance protein A-like domain-containing protein n=1 Tax=Christiangramia fulva TaxID=2126553 RepID=A0A2R3Z5D1_9FLAO|nr:type II CAAX endopeptidase family protein [Christiangramia fulva]AVR45422.1 hypothetical protein C7S20_09135 [Christiangramia fulva]